MSKHKTKSGQAAAKIAKWKFQDHMSFLNEFLNQDRPRLSSTNSNEEEDDSYKEIQEEKERDSEEHTETETTSFKNNNATNNELFQSNLKKTEINKRKQKSHNVIQESASATLIKYLIEKKEQESEKDNRAAHPIDNFFSVMAATVKNFSPIDQHYIKTKIFTIVNDMEGKYLMQSSAHFTPSVQPPAPFTPFLQQSPAHFTPSPQQSPAHFTSSPQQSPAHFIPSPQQSPAYLTSFPQQSSIRSSSPS